MSASDDFNDADAMLAARRASDERLLTTWLEKHNGLNGFFKKLEAVKADGFSFAVASDFEPKADAPSDGYVSPKLTRTLTFTAGDKTETLRLSVALSGEWTLKGFERNETGTAKNELQAKLDGWVADLNTANPDLNIEAHVKRAGAKVGSEPKNAPTKTA